MAEPELEAAEQLSREEAGLARAAAAGDGDAFATLYQRYSQRAYNVSVRLCGSDEDAADAVQEAFLSVMRRLPSMAERELAFGSYLFTATRNATYDLMRRQQRSRPTGDFSESATPVGAGAGGLGLDPGDPDEDPDRRQLLAAQQEQIKAANSRLPQRQREALALRELEELSYDEIAATMGMNRNSVAQLISRARINLREEIRGGAFASVAAAAPECERALPLISMRDDGQLDPGDPDLVWLQAHLAGCGRCAVATQVMEEAGVSYRAWIPVAVAPALFHETMARAAELTGSDWSEVIRRRAGDRAIAPGAPAAYRVGAELERAAAVGHRRGRRTAVLAGLAAVLAIVGVAALAAPGEDSEPPAEVAPRVEEAAAKQDQPRRPEPVRRPARGAREREPGPRPQALVVDEREAFEAPTGEAPVAVPEADHQSATGTESEAKPDRSSGGSGAVDTPQTVTEPKSESKPKPEPEATPEPAPEPLPEAVVPVEEPPAEEVPPTRPPRGELPPRPPPGGGPRG